MNGEILAAAGGRARLPASTTPDISGDDWQKAVETRPVFLIIDTPF
jgi:hypothetical protein